MTLAHCAGKWDVTTARCELVGPTLQPLAVIGRHVSVDSSRTLRELSDNGLTPPPPPDCR